MSSPIAPALPPEVLSTLDPLGEAIKKGAIARKVGVHVSVYNKDFVRLWSTQNEGVPGMMAKVNVSKAKSLLAGETLKNPSMPQVMCCYMPCWACGCSNMPVWGCSRIEIAGTDAACIIVNGAPGAHIDKAILEEGLASCGFTIASGSTTYEKGGAPEGAGGMER